MAVEEAEKKERERGRDKGRVTCRGREREQMPMNHIGHTTLSLSHSRVGFVVRVESRRRSRESEPAALAKLRPAGDTLGPLTLAYMGAQCRCQCR